MDVGDDVSDQMCLLKLTKIFEMSPTLFFVTNINMDEEFVTKMT